MKEGIQRGGRTTDLRDALRQLNGRPLVVFDLETNGLSNHHSVLACSAFKFRIATHTNRGQVAAEPSTSYLFPSHGPLELVERFERFYLPKESLSSQAVKIHGLSMDVLIERRANRNWPVHFADDEEFLSFLQPAGLFVAHNVDFDTQFVPFLYDKTRFCTMKSNTTGKYPKLEELARRFGIETDPIRFHDSSYDTYITSLIFNRMVADALPDVQQHELLF